MTTETIGDFLKGVKETVSNSTNDVLERVKDSLVQKELEQRKAHFLAAIAKLQELQREGYKIKPDVGIMFDADGKPKGEPGFSKERAEDLKKNREAIEKVERAIAKAFEGDWTKVAEIAGK